MSVATNEDRRHEHAAQCADIAELAAEHLTRLCWSGQLHVDSRVVRLMIMIITRVVAVGLAVFFLVVGAAAQVSLSPESDELKAKCGSQIRSTYLLGPDDQLEISGPELTEFANKPVRIDDDGIEHGFAIAIRKTHPQRAGFMDSLAPAAARPRRNGECDPTDGAIAGEDFVV